MQNMIFAFEKRSGARLCEIFSDNSFRFQLSGDGSSCDLLLYNVDHTPQNAQEFYLGHSVDEVLACGRDMLGEELLKNGDPEYQDVKKTLPRISKGSYTILGGPASWSGVTVDHSGAVIHQLSGRNRTPSPIFEPSWVDAKLGPLPPRQMLLGGEYPILVSLHTDGEKCLEFLYFVEPGDTDRDPITWIRIKRYQKNDPKNCSVEYRVAAIAREKDEHVLAENPPSEQIFLDALFDTVSFWVNYCEQGTKMSLPEAEIAKVARSAMAFTALTFTGDHPHYGHRSYGKELHDNFPPNYIWAIEAACLSGRAYWAGRVLTHLLEYALNDDGRFCYRQGTSLCFGASATEYGMLLYIINKYKAILCIDTSSDILAKKLLGMGDEILAHCLPCPEFGGKVLVKMCAEADTNERVNVYLNNNLWAIRGFEALVELFSCRDVSAYADMARTLSENVDYMLKAYTVKGTRFGDLVPFRFGYTATPLTLSTCRDAFRPMTTEESNVYFSTGITRGPESCEQDLTENTYANYRYYPEILSAMLLPDKYADAIVTMRENIGGELLGMTRFFSWIDNWPVLQYARFLIESGRIEKYLLLLYSHIAHHGDPELMSYYEQFYIHGEVKAPDCIPSLLTAPIMVSWIFAYERMNDGVLQILSALPEKWYTQPFSVKKIGYSQGTLDVVSYGDSLTVSFSSPLKSAAEIVIRAKETFSVSDITEGVEYVDNICGNKIFLKAGTSYIKLKTK